MDHKMWILLGLLTVCACSPSAKKEEPVVENPLLSEVTDIKNQITDLSKKIEETREDKKDDHEGHEGEEGSPTEIEILKQVQALNRRLMSIEQKVSGGHQEVSEEVVKSQIIDVAKATLAQDPSVGPGFITSAQLIEVTPGEEVGEWQVKIKFKKNRTDPSVKLATMFCKNENNVVSCEDVVIGSVT